MLISCPHCTNQIHIYASKSDKLELKKVAELHPKAKEFRDFLHENYSGKTLDTAHLCRLFSEFTSIKAVNSLKLFRDLRLLGLPKSRVKRVGKEILRFVDIP